MSYNQTNSGWGHVPANGSKRIWNRLSGERVNIRFCENYVTFSRKGVRYEILVTEISDGTVYYELQTEDRYRMTWDECQCEGNSVWHAVADVMPWALGRSE